MPVPILRQGEVLIASIQSELSDMDLRTLREQLGALIGRSRSRALIIDVAAVEVLDSFAARTLRGISHEARLRGAQTIVVGIQPDVAFAMVKLGLSLEGVSTALDLDDALALIRPPT